MKQYVTNIIIFFVFSFFVAFNSNASNPTINKGILDLSNFNFADNEPIKLNGEWIFFENKLIFPLNYDSIYSKYLKVPSKWNSETNYGTYYLKIILPENSKSLAFHKIRFMNCSKMWINNELVLEQGKISDTKDNIVSQDFPQIVYYFPKSDTLNIVIQISNFFHQRGGIISPILMSSPEKIEHSKSISLALQFIIIGILILIVISQLSLYYFHKQLPYLLFGIASILSILSIITEGDFLIYYILPNIKLASIYKLHYFANYLRVPVFVIFLTRVFETGFKKTISYILLIIGSLLSMFIIFTPPIIFTQTINIFNITTVFSVFYLLFGLVRVSLKKIEGAKLSLLGFVILFITIFNDILFDSGIIHSIYIVSYGVIVFIIIQSAIMSLRFTLSYKKNEKLTSELKYINENLENLVKERTIQIEQQNEEIKAQSEFLLNFNEEILSKNNLLERKNHEIIQSISYALKIQTAVLTTEEYINKYLSEYFILNIPRDIVSGDFYWLRKIEDTIIIVVADCTGHGVPGAFMSMLCISFHNELVTKDRYQNPANTLTELRNMVKYALNQTGKALEQKDGMDISFAEINLKSNILTFAGAYNSLIIIRDNQLTVLEADKQPIAIYTHEKDFTNKTFELQKNDCVYLHTDGYPDQFGGEDNRKFMMRNFKNLLINNYLKSMIEQKQVLLQTHLKWKGMYDQIDDILVMGVRI